MRNTNKSENLDCLLINPPDDFSRYPYLGLCQLAAVLREKGISVEILDTAALGLSIEECVNVIVRKQPHIIGISIMSITLRPCYDLIQALNQAYSDAVIVVGGAHINADPDILIPMGIKYGFRGECDLTFAEFCRSILDGVKPENIGGMIVNDNGIITFEDPPVIPDLSTLPLPAYDLLPLDRYFSPNTSFKTISIIVSRGCPYNCVYCSKLMKTSYRFLETQSILDILYVLVRGYNFQWVEFVDEIFTLKRQNVIDLCRGIENSGMKFSWGIQTRADKLDEELIDIMAKAGCKKIGFGIETGSEKIRFLGNKQITNQQYMNTINLCKRYRLKTVGHYIFGHIGETVDDMHETVRFASTLRTDIMNFNKMIPIPNSELFESAKHDGTVDPDIWTDYMLGKISCPLYYPPGVSEKVVDRIYKTAWLKAHLSFRVLWQHVWILVKPKTLYRSVKAFITLTFGKRYDR